MKSIVTCKLLICVFSIAEAIPVGRKCDVSNGLLNPLLGYGVKDKGEFEAEEEAVGLVGNPSPIEIAQMTTTNGTLSELSDCLQEYGKQPVIPISKPETPPGGVETENSSLQMLLPFTDVKEQEVPGKGDYFTTYDASKYNFKDKGFVIETHSPAEENPPRGTSKPTKSSKKNKNELSKWYNAFISVVASYM